MNTKLNKILYTAGFIAIFSVISASSAYAFGPFGGSGHRSIAMPPPVYHPRPVHIPVPIPVQTQVQTPIYNYSNPAPTYYPVYYPVYTPTYTQSYTPTYTQPYVQTYSQPYYTPSYNNYSNYSSTYIPYSTGSYSNSYQNQYTYQNQYASNQYAYNPSTYSVNQSNSSGLIINCSNDPAIAGLNQPTTWNASVTGGVAPYTFSWSGSDGLSGTQSSIVKYYNTYGEKTAIVTITSADGRNSTYSCDNVMTIKDLGGNGNTLTQNQNNEQASSTATSTATSTNTNAAAVGLSGGVPWGWIAFLIILILLAATVYLLIGRQRV